MISPGLALLLHGLAHGDANAPISLLVSAALLGGQLLLPLYFLKVRGASPGLTGLLLAPMALGMFVSLPVMGRLRERFGARMISGAGTATARSAPSHSPCSSSTS